MKAAITGTRWAQATRVLRALDRELRVTPGLTLVTQPHFLGKIVPWAKSNLVLLECVQAPNRFAANEQLLAQQANEFLVFDQDRYVEHLLGCLRTPPSTIPVRHYTP